jgi:hypothetical protein
MIAAVLMLAVASSVALTVETVIVYAAIERCEESAR